jgi:hypothetical protein
MGALVGVWVGWVNYVLRIFNPGRGWVCWVSGMDGLVRYVS